MNRKEFLVNLNKELKDLPKGEVENIINYYKEYLNDLDIRDTDEIDSRIESPKKIAEEVYAENAKTLQIKVEEIKYSINEIEELEKEVIYPEVTILEEHIKIKENKESRKMAFEKIKCDVENSLYEGEEIILKTIIVPDPKRAVMVYRTVYNEVIFVTNERMFIYSLDLNYKELEKRYVSNIDNISAVEFDNYGGWIYLCFKDGKRFRLKAYRKADRRLMFIMLKYLSENEVEFNSVKYN